jgi:putative glutamine amidotransferase
MTKPVIGIGADIVITKGERDRAFAFTTYTEALRRAGAVVVIVPPQPENAPDVVASLDGILLAGGDDYDPAAYGEERHASCETMDPRRQENELALAKAARERGIPTLGICLGLQSMNVAAGGTLIQDIATALETDIDHASEPYDRHRHQVLVENGTKLAKILGGGEHSVNSSHHQAVGRVADGLHISALAPDGIVEALEDALLPFYVGVQWHPEDMTGESDASTLFRAFIDAAKMHAERRAAAATELSPVGARRPE